MDVIKSLFLGVIQGLTEFLPVSSSGHLVIAQAFLDIQPAGGVVFEVALHLATLVAILLFYRRRVWSLLLGVLNGDSSSWRFTAKLAVATLPAIAVALTARDWIERQFESLTVAGTCLLVTGVIVWSTRYSVRHGHDAEPTWIAALLIGCAQAFAILPGISRSGTTMAAAMALGVGPLAAAEFSFLLGVIAIAGAGVLIAPDMSAASVSELIDIGIGSAAALISGLVAIWLFLLLLRGRRFHLFAWYAWTLGLVTLIASALAT